MKFNFKPSLPDLRDHIYRSDSAEVLREIVDFREKDTIVESQGTLGSCSSNALTNAYEISVNFQYPDKLKQLSRLFIYYNTREMNGNVLEDNGIFLRDGLKSLSKYGVCTEELWPYEIDKFDDKPTEQCYDDAIKRKIVGYQKLINQSANRDVFSFAVVHYIKQEGYDIWTFQIPDQSGD